MGAGPAMCLASNTLLSSHVGSPSGSSLDLASDLMLMEGVEAGNLVSWVDPLGGWTTACCPGEAALFSTGVPESSSSRGPSEGMRMSGSEAHSVRKICSCSGVSLKRFISAEWASGQPPKSFSCGLSGAVHRWSVGSAWGKRRHAALVVRGRDQT